MHCRHLNSKSRPVMTHKTEAVKRDGQLVKIYQSWGS